MVKHWLGARISQNVDFKRIDKNFSRKKDNPPSWACQVFAFKLRDFGQIGCEPEHMLNALQPGFNLDF